MRRSGWLCFSVKWHLRHTVLLREIIYAPQKHAGLRPSPGFVISGEANLFLAKRMGIL